MFVEQDPHLSPTFGPVSGHDEVVVEPLHDAKELQAPHLCPTELPVPGQDVELLDPEQVNTETVSGSPEHAVHLSPTFGP